MKVLQNVFQVVGRPAFLILFLFGFLGAECGRVTGGGSDPTQQETEQALAKKQAEIEAAEKAAEELRQKAEAARKAGEAAKAAELERQQREAEAEAEKQRQIKTALQTAASSVNRAHEAVEKVATAKKQIARTGFASGKPFSGLEAEAKKARAEAFKAYDAVHTATEVSTAFDKAEEVALAANKAEKQAQIAEGFVSRFQDAFTFNESEKSLFSSSTSNVESTCSGYLQELSQPLPSSDLVPVVTVQPSCKLILAPPGSAGVLDSYNCSCGYNSGKFWKK